MSNPISLPDIKARQPWWDQRLSEWRALVSAVDGLRKMRAVHPLRLNMHGQIPILSIAQDQRRQRSAGTSGIDFAVIRDIEMGGSRVFVQFIERTGDGTYAFIGDVEPVFMWPGTVDGDYETLRSGAVSVSTAPVIPIFTVGGAPYAMQHLIFDVAIAPVLGFVDCPRA